MKNSVRHSLLISCVFLARTLPLCGQEPAPAERSVDGQSPDGKYALLRIFQPDADPARTCDLIEKATGKVLLRAGQSDDGKNWLGVVALWSADSKRCALFITYNHFGAALSIYQKTGDTFHELTLPDLAAPEIPDRLTRGHEWKWTGLSAASADRWRRDGTLVVRTESTLQAINSFLSIIARRTTVLGVSRSGKVSVLRSRQRVFFHDES